jgi:hypothetical protein
MFPFFSLLVWRLAEAASGADPALYRDGAGGRRLVRARRVPRQE